MRDGPASGQSLATRRAKGGLRVRVR